MLRILVKSVGGQAQQLHSVAGFRQIIFASDLLEPRQRFAQLGLCLCFRFDLRIQVYQIGETGLGLGLNLTQKQFRDLQGLVDEYTIKNINLLDQLEMKAFELKQELRKVDRCKNKFTEYNSVYRANALVREISKLRGEQIKLKTSYLLKAKDVLTTEQRLRLIERILEFEANMPEETFIIVEEQILQLDLGLTTDQVKKIMRHRADMEKNAIDLELKIDMQLIDLQVVLSEPEIDSNQINNIIMTTTDLLTRLSIF